MEIISIGSSSSGNSYIVKAGSKNILLDVGLSAAKIVSALGDCSIGADDVDAVLITHEHVDHVKSVRTIAKKCPNAKFYVSGGTLRNCPNFGYVDQSRIETVSAGDSWHSGDDEVEVRCFELSHDAAEPVGFSVIAEGKQLTVVTDTGIVTEEIFQEMLHADILVFEANHEESLLMYGEYPYSVKMRIKSDVGHLSNVTSGEVLARLLKERKEEQPIEILLAHLSDKNNSPYQARITIEGVLGEHGYVRDKDYTMSIAAKEGLTYL